MGSDDRGKDHRLTLQGRAGNQNPTVDQNCMALADVGTEGLKVASGTGAEEMADSGGSWDRGQVGGRHSPDT